MDCISHGIRSKSSSEGSWSLLLGLLSVGWTQDISEPGDGILCHQLHTGADIALHISIEVGEEWLATVLLVELVGLLGLAEPTHLQLGNGETVLVNGINNFSGLSVTVWFDHGKCSSGSGFKLVLSEDVSIVCELELTREHSNDGAEVELLDRDALNGHSLHEHSSLFDVVLNKRLKKGG